jgi:hypothetical protein
MGLVRMQELLANRGVSRVLRDPPPPAGLVRDDDGGCGPVGRFGEGRAMESTERTMNRRWFDDVG